MSTLSCRAVAHRPRCRRRYVPCLAGAGLQPLTLLRNAALAALSSSLLLTSTAEAALFAPNTRLPRTAEAALRRAVPVVHKPTGDVQEKLESVMTLLRIPQRKNWAGMLDSIDDVARLLADDRDSLMEAVPPSKRIASAEVAARLEARLGGVYAAMRAQDADATASRIAAALSDVSLLEIAQAPGLPFSLPSQYARRARLVGRATVEVTVGRSNGQLFERAPDGSGAHDLEVLHLELDGYNAPLTAGNIAALVERGAYDGTPLVGSDSAEAVFVTPGPRVAPLDAAPLPLEVRATSGFEPVYRVPLDVFGGGDLPVLPLSVYGAAAMSRGTGGNDSDPTTFFFYRFSRNSAGLGGLAFDEGQFAVFGYVTDGQNVLKQLRSGDRIITARLVAGRDNLITP